MSISVRVPTILRPFVDGASSVDVDPNPATLKGVLDALEAAGPGITQRVVSDAGELRRFVNVYINDDDVRFLDGLDTVVKDGDTVSVVPAVAGGC
jgi:molybdopterin synthase sulfur carrier subunit